MVRALMAMIHENATPERGLAILSDSKDRNEDTQSREHLSFN
jgi:hypothetical protein